MISQCHIDLQLDYFYCVGGRWSIQDLLLVSEYLFDYGIDSPVLDVHALSSRLNDTTGKGVGF